jgi:preprotein translocase subunit SecF
MKRVIRFSQARYWFFLFSAALIVIGVVAFIANHGLNLGVDFKAGVAYQFQVAPASFTVQYTGPDKAEISIPAGEQALTAPGDIIFTVTSAANGSKKTFPFRYASFQTVRDLTDAIAKQVSGVSVVVKGDASAPPTQLEPLPRPADISNTPYTINRAPGPGRGVETTISEVRALMTPMGEFSLQAVGAPANQEFIARIPVAPGAVEATFQQNTEKSLLGILEGKFGQGQIILKSTDFVGARMAQSLASQTIWLVLVAVLLILLYMTFRFHPWIYAVAAVLGIVHDAVVMLAFDAVFRVEIDAGTIAAILTILGYSINDTIVNFDRARENTGLMRGESLRLILDTSVTQNLSRTFITSGATLLTVIALFILTSGSIKNFALNMIVGILEGTYSTFISAFFVIEWVNWRERRKKSDTLAKYGITTAEKPELVAAAAEAEAEFTEDEGEELPEGFVPGALAAEAPGVGAVPVTAGASAQPAVPAGQAGTAAASVGGTQGAAPGARPAASANTPFPGQTGSRKHKKHRRHRH